MKKKHFLILLILLVGVGAATALIKTAPKPEKRALEVQAPLVELKAFQEISTRPTWQAGATVNAKAIVKLVTQVSGQIEDISSSVIPGAFVKKGGSLAQIDRANYQLLVTQKKAQVTQAQASLDMELAQVENAKNDYRLSGMQLKAAAKSLALREPQLASAKAVLASAQADLAKAQLDLERTYLKMPFNGHVMKQLVGVGAFVNNATPIFEIVNSDAYWLEVKVPQDFVTLMDQHKKVTINKLGSTETREGKILSILPQVDETDRQVRVLISIEDPLALNSDVSAIRYNDYVQVTLFGQQLENVVQLKTDELNGQQDIWVVDKNLTLQKRVVNVIYSGRMMTWANVDKKIGDQLLSSPLALSKVGMPIRIHAVKSTALAEQEGAL
jgi:RND family efflux transporter MFP subunit